MASSTLGGLILGSILLMINYFISNLIPTTFHQKIILITISFFLVLELANKSKILPSGNFAVPAHWLRIGGNKIAVLWGVILGLGIITYQAGTLFHAFILLSVFSDNLLFCLIAGGIFGFTRATISSIPFFRQSIYYLIECRINGITALTLSRKIISIMVILMTMATLFIKIKEVI